MICVKTEGCFNISVSLHLNNFKLNKKLSEFLIKQTIFIDFIPGKIKKMFPDHQL